MVIKPFVKVAKNIFKKPETMMFPEEREQITDNYRGIHKLDIETCISCGACARICPNETIDMVDVETEKGIKKMPQVNLDRCLFCDLCEEVCPTDCLILTKDYDFEAYDKRKFVRRPEDLK